MYGVRRESLSLERARQCRYGPKCQFAHGKEELRSVNRHPKYKTMKCKSYWANPEAKYCPYGSRCRFVHEDDATEENEVPITRAKSASVTIPIPAPTTSHPSRPISIPEPEPEKTPWAFREGKTHMKMSPVMRKKGGALLSAFEDIWTQNKTPDFNTTTYRGAYKWWRSKPESNSSETDASWKSTAFQPYGVNSVAGTPESLGVFFESALTDEKFGNAAAQSPLAYRECRRTGSSPRFKDYDSEYRSHYQSWRKHASSFSKEDEEFTLAGRIAAQALLGTSIED